MPVAKKAPSARKSPARNAAKPAAKRAAPAPGRTAKSAGKDAAPSTPKRGNKRVNNRADSRLPQLMEAAAALFASRGFEGTSVRDIVGRVGMLPGSLYAHFDNKEELLLAVYEEGVERIRAAVEQALADEDEPWERLEVACRAHLDNLLKKNGYAQVVIRVRPEDVPGVSRQLVALRDSYEQIFRQLVARLPLVTGVDRRGMRLFLLGALNWSPEWYKPGGDSPRKIASGFIKLLRRAPGR